MFIVGLTGGIGSGKTTVANIFSELNVPIIDADEIAREVVTLNSTLLTAIVQRFGTKILQSNGELNRAALRKIIFEDPIQKKWLEELLHPAIDRIILEKISKVSYPYCIVVIPLLAENYARYQKLLSHIVVMNTHVDRQRDQATKRDQENPLMIEKIIHSQISQNDRLKIADTILDNDGTLKELKNKVHNLHNYFLQQSIDN